MKTIFKWLQSAVDLGAWLLSEDSPYGLTACLFIILAVIVCLLARR